MSLLTVTTPADDLALLTVAELRAAAGLAATDGSLDTELAALGRRVAATITGTCRIARAGAVQPTLRSETLSETFRLSCERRELVLARRPIGAIASVTENGTVLESAVYETDDAAGLLYRLSADTRACWPAVKIVVAYTAGWATVPQDLALAASKLAAMLWHEGRRGDPSLRSESIPGVREVSYWVSPRDDQAIPQEVLDLLGPYINPVIG